MKILAISKDKPGKKIENFQPHLEAEARQIYQLQQMDIIREVYFRQDEPSAVLILECENMKMAQASLNTLPLVKNELITFELIPLQPYPGFDRLFNISNRGTGASYNSNLL